MANQSNLSNSVDISFGKSSTSRFTVQLRTVVLQIISIERGSLGKVIAVLYVIAGTDQLSHFKGVGKKSSHKVFFNNVDYHQRINERSWQPR